MKQLKHFFQEHWVAIWLAALGAWLLFLGFQIWALNNNLDDVFKTL